MKNKNTSQKKKEQKEICPEDQGTEALENKIIDVIKKSDPKIAEKSIGEIQKVIRTVQMESHFQGPLPPPEILKGYNNIVPDAAERIITMAEKQATHRQFIEKRIVYGGTRNETLGLFMAFTIVMVAIIGGFILINNDKDILGLSTIITAIAGAASIFIVGKKQESKKDKSREEINKK